MRPVRVYNNSLLSVHRIEHVGTSRDYIVIIILASFAHTRLVATTRYGKYKLDTYPRKQT